MLVASSASGRTQLIAHNRITLRSETPCASVHDVESMSSRRFAARCAGSAQPSALWRGTCCRDYVAASMVKNVSCGIPRVVGSSTHWMNIEASKRVCRGELAYRAGADVMLSAIQANGKPLVRVMCTVPSADRRTRLKEQRLCRVAEEKGAAVRTDAQGYRCKHACAQSRFSALCSICMLPRPLMLHLRRLSSAIAAIATFTRRQRYGTRESRSCA